MAEGEAPSRLRSAILQLLQFYASALYAHVMRIVECDHAFAQFCGNATLEVVENGGQGRNRTADASLFRAALYHLSYLATGAPREEEFRQGVAAEPLRAQPNYISRCSGLT